jgi:hypothetical protein
MDNCPEVKPSFESYSEKILAEDCVTACVTSLDRQVEA